MTEQPITDLNLFSGQSQHQNFCRFKDLLPTKRMAASSRPFVLPQASSIALASTYAFDGSQRSSETFLDTTDTAALLVLQNGQVRHETYRLSGGRDVQWISWSVAKSFVSALVGIALKEGQIRSLADQISDYISVEPGSAYDGVSIKNVLQMASGARWNEDYNDPTSDVHRLGATMAGTMSLDAFVATMVKDVPQGTVCRYNSGDTQALGALLVRATGQSLTD